MPFDTGVRVACQAQTRTCDLWTASLMSYQQRHHVSSIEEEEEENLLSTRMVQVNKAVSNIMCQATRIAEKPS